MIFRFKLYHDILGEKEISEPSGWLGIKLTLERHPDFASLVEYFNGDFVFYGNTGTEDGGIDFIRQVESNYGVDAKLTITIELAPDNYTFETVFTGQLDLSTINEMQDNKAQIAIIPDDFWSKFINRYDTQVNIQSDEDLDGGAANAIEHVNLHALSQPLRSRIIASFTNDDYGLVNFGDWGYNQYGAVFFNYPDFIQIDWPNHTLAEVKDEYSLPLSPNSEKPVSKIIAENAGDYTFNITVDLLNRSSDLTPPFPFPSDQYDLKIEFSDGTIVTASTVDTVSDYLPSPGVYNKFTRYTINTTKSLPEAGTASIYFEKIALVADLGGVSYVYDGLVNSNITGYTPINTFSVTANTTFPTTDANSFFLHDVAGSISDRILGVQDSFYSEFLGGEETKYRAYVENGCQFHYVLVPGLQLRGYNLVEKPYSISMKKWFEGINPIIPVSLMLDEVGGEQVIRVEDREHCFDSTSTSVDISYVREISRKYDPDQLFKTIKIGFKKWESEDISGIDDPQTKHTYASQLKRTGKDLTLESEFISASYAIETTRRKTRLKSADYKFDNDTFIVSVNPTKQTISPDASPEIDDYIPELDENFSSVDGLLNFDTRYNIRLTPGRSFLRWLKFLSASVYQYTGSLFKFTYGEGNYEMESTINDSCEPEPSELAENQDITADQNPVYLPFEYEFTNVPLDWEDYRAIAANSKKAIGISQTDENHTKFFIKKLEYDIVEGTASITAWPKTYMDILVIEGDFLLKECASDVILDGCYRITEDGDLRILEDNDFRILEEC